MRRPIVIIIGFIVLVFAIVVMLFGLKGPEMPIQEVHKVLSLSKFQQQATTPPIPTIPSASAPGNTMQPAVNAQQPIPAMPQPSAAPANTTNTVGQPVGNTVPQGAPAPTPAPVTPQVATVPNNVGNTVQPQQQSTVPLIIPQQNPAQGNVTGQPAANPQQQAIPAMPQAATVPGNATGNTAQ